MTISLADMCEDQNAKFEETAQTGIAGLLVSDAQAIKQTLLRACALIGPGEAFTAAQDLASAFRFLDDEVFERSEYEQKARKEAEKAKASAHIPIDKTPQTSG